MTLTNALEQTQDPVSPVTHFTPFQKGCHGQKVPGSTKTIVTQYQLSKLP